MRSHAKAATAGSNPRQVGRGRSRSTHLVLAVALLVAGLASLTASPAFALPPTTFAKGIVQAGDGARGAGEINAPLGMAVDQSSGDVYIADRNNFRIDKFDASGDFLMAWGFGVADGTTQQLQTCGPEATPPTTRCFAANFFSIGNAGYVAPERVAVDPASGAVYVTDPSRNRVTKFSSNGQFLLMFGKNVNKTPGTLTPNVCTAADLSVPGAVCGNGQVGSGAGEFFSFLAPTAIAVDAAGHVWVGDDNRLVQFDSGGNYVSQAPIAGGGQTTDLARNSAGDIYVKSASLTGVRKYTPSGSPIDTLTLSQTFDASGKPQSLAIDGAGNLYVADRPASGKAFFMKFNPAGEQVSQFGAGQVAGTSSGPYDIAVGDTAAALYADSGGFVPPTEEPYYAQRFPLPEPGPLPENQHVNNLEPTTATLAAELNPEGHTTTYHFEYGTTASYGQSTTTKTLPGSAFNSEAVQEALAGLIPNTTYHFRLVATNHCKTSEPSVECTVVGPDTAFTTRPAVAIDAQWATDITSTSVVLRAELDPIGVAGQWWIEYGTSESYGSATAESALPASFGDLSLATLIQGLSPNTVYHYRFAARDVRDGNTYVVHGPDKTFTTQVSGLGFSLADSRAWEMVSPPDKFGALIISPHGQGGPLQAAADGNGLVYATAVSIEPEPEGNRVLNESSVLARRDGSGAWHSKDISLPNTKVVPISLGSGIPYKLFSPNLERSLVEPADDTPFSPAASERSPYLRENTEPGTYTVLVTGKEGFANVPPGTKFGGDMKVTPTGNVQVAGANPELDHVVLKSTVSLAAGVPALSIYLWSDGELRPVAVKPAGEGGGAVAAVLGASDASIRKAISDDGSRVFWSTPAGVPNSLYVRDMDREETVRLDVVQPGSFGVGGANPVFQGANSEGTVAFFTDSHQLTDDANEAGRDLYRCEVTEEGGELGCDLTDITAETVGAKESAEVQSLASGMGDDATHVYFVARGVLDSQPNAMGDSAVSGQPNLYLWQEGGGTRFIATLASEDGADWSARPGGGVSNGRALTLAAAASPSGRYLSFMSQRSLTGYDNRDAKTGELDQEVFRYDANTDELICASCNPSGASPVGRHGHEGTRLKAFEPLNLWSGKPLAAVLPEADHIGFGQTLYRPRAVQDNGRLFFNAADSLVAADSNGNWDVYQYEPSGLGDCSTSSGGAAISRSAGGCVSLISSGAGEEEAAFLDASEGGDDVFFYTSAQLSVTDEDQEVDVYDARVDGVPAVLTPNAECLGEACQPPARVPDDPTPASASFRGQGNQQPSKSSKPRCAKGKRKVTSKGKSRCVPRKHKRHAKRAANGNRGAKR